MTTGAQIKAARKARRLTQEDLGKALGVSSSFIAQYETGKRNPKYKTLCRIAEALQIPVFLFVNSESENIDYYLHLKSELDSVRQHLRDPSVPDEDKQEELYEEETHLIEALNEFETMFPDIIKTIVPTKAKISIGPLQKMSDADAHKACFLQFKSDEDRIAYFYSALNIDGKLAASKCFYQHLDKASIREIANYVEGLTKIPQYQRKETPPEALQEPPEGKE